MGDSTVESIASVSVVIPTYNRCEDCKRAALSALEQEPAPLEVLVCDDGSTDGTQAELERWQAEEPRLRYLRLPVNRGTPAPARNLGISSAHGDWVAFLDDDDCWLPGKLSLQTPFLVAGGADVVGTNAFRLNGRSYFQLEADLLHLSRADIERANPIILSSAITRRSLLTEADGFDESHALAGVEDYDLWLRLADRGTRFVVLCTPTVDYRDLGDARLSSARSKIQGALLKVRLRRWRQTPTDALVLRSALRECALTVRMLTAILWAQRARDA